ncbi:MAG: glycosyltransferase family 2 protein [Candidatus Saliniplasma sp.]
MISAVIPAYNEEERIEEVLLETNEFVDEIVVVDDASLDGTPRIACKHAELMVNPKNFGYIESLKKGFIRANGDIIVTLDADGEHDPSYIPKLVKPIQEGKADLVFGSRNKIHRPSERLISKLVRSKTGIYDTGTGFRALRSELAEKLELQGYCTCGTLVLEALYQGAELAEVEAPTRTIKKPRDIAWQHIPQLFLVLKLLAGFGLKSYIKN